MRGGRKKQLAISNQQLSISNLAIGSQLLTSGFSHCTSRQLLASNSPSSDSRAQGAPGTVGALMDNSSKPDLKAGFLFDQLPDGGMVLGQVDGEDVVLARRSDELFAVGASCTHYHGPLAEGLMV